MDYLVNGWTTFNKLLDTPGQLVITCVSFFLLILLGLKGRASWKRKDGLSDNKNRDKKQHQQVTTVEDIPRHYHFPMVPMPTVVEGLSTVYNLKQEGVKIMECWAQQYGPIYEIAVLTRKVFAVSDPPLIQKILGSTDIHVLNKPRYIYDQVLREWFRHGMVGNEVDVWAPHKKMAVGTYHYKAFPGYLKIMNKHGKALVGNLVSECPASGSLQGQLIYDELYSHTMKIISEIPLGPDSSSGKKSEEFHEHFKQWRSLSLYRLFHPENLIPLVWWLNPKSKEYDHHVSKIRDYIYQGIERVQQEMEMERGNDEGKNGLVESGTLEGIKPPRSLIQEMLHCNATKEEIYHEVGTFLSAGHDTTQVAINLFMQHMADNPDIQANCHRELDELYKSKQKSEETWDEKSNWDYLTLEDLSQLKYLERCILESLRITPAAPLFFRELSAPMEFGDFKFKTGTTFGFSPWAVHRDPGIYPNPEKFDPDRFLPENVKTRHPFSFIPFSQGPRICLGRKLALMEMKVILAWLLRHFEIYSGDRLHDVKMLFEITILLEREYRIVLKKREHIC